MKRGDLVEVVRMADSVVAAYLDHLFVRAVRLNGASKHVDNAIVPGEPLSG